MDLASDYLQDAIDDQEARAARALTRLRFSVDAVEAAFRAPVLETELTTTRRATCTGSTQSATN